MEGGGVWRGCLEAGLTLLPPPRTPVQGAQAASSHETELLSLMLAAKRGLSALGETGFRTKLERLERRGDAWIAQVSRHLRSLLEDQMLEAPYKRAFIPDSWSRDPWYDNVQDSLAEVTRMSNDYDAVSPIVSESSVISLSTSTRLLARW